MYYNVPVTISKQEDGLWRAEAPSIQGCFVDAETLEQALADIHEVIVMMLDLDLPETEPIPDDVVRGEALPISVTVPVVPSEHRIRHYAQATTRKRRK